MPRGRRTKIAVGVYQDAGGVAATIKVKGRQKEKRFEAGTELDTIKRWQAKARGELLIEEPIAKPAKGSLLRSVARYLKTRKGLPGYAADRAHLRAWTSLYGTRQRHTLTRLDVLSAFAYWRTEGQRRRFQKIARPVSPQTLVHRYRALKDLFHGLDGPDAPTPCDDVQRPAIPKSVPRDVNLRIIRKVCRRLEQRYPLDHARFLVLATTGRRPVEIMRTDVAKDLDLKRGSWTVPAAKGSEPTQLQLNDEMIAAWQLAITVKATGDYDTSLYAKRLRRCGWPKGLRPYNARHAVAMEILRQGGDLSDVQQHLGHRSIETTRQFYAGAIREREQQTSARLTGRLRNGASRRVPADQGRTMTEQAGNRRFVTPAEITSSERPITKRA